MLFNSYQFFIFFPIVAFLYFSLNYKYRNLFLLAASYYFYMCWKPEYIILIIASTLIDYFVGLRLEKAKAPNLRRNLLILSLFTNLGLLFAFKYFNFFNDSARALFDYFNIFYNVPSFKVLLPVGISFYTFQTLSYTIDLFQNKRKAEKSLSTFALYVAFFPQLVAGPIERSTRLLPQFYKKHEFDYTRITDGLKLVSWGLFKKIVIADRLAILVNTVYNNTQDYTGIQFIVATIFFAFQIYCDFSGYSDIAIGTAKILGFDLMKNFDRPYFAKSIGEFWKRWHISLSSWFRDYLYIPLGGSKVKSVWNWRYNVLIVFLLSGLWHGAKWTFVVWGALHGFFLIFGALTQNIRNHIAERLKLNSFPTFYKLIKVSITFSLVTFSWIFFRANNLKDAFYIITKMISGSFETIQAVLAKNYFLVENLVYGKGFGMSKGDLMLSFFLIAFLILIFLIQRNGSIINNLKTKPLIVRWLLYYAIIFVTLIWGIYGAEQFIYFQF